MFRTHSSQYESRRVMGILNAAQFEDLANPGIIDNDERLLPVISEGQNAPREQGSQPIFDLPRVHSHDTALPEQQSPPLRLM